MHGEPPSRCRTSQTGSPIVILCPSCSAPLSVEAERADCPTCGNRYPVEAGVVVFSPQEALYEDMQMEPIRVPAFERVRGPFRWLAAADFWLSRKQVRLRFLYDAVRSLVPDRPHLVLDVGSGGGKHTLTRLGPVVGVDISLRALINARHTYQACVRQDVRRGLPFPDAAFDVVNCADVLGHFDEPGRDRLLAEINRVLRPGGWFIAVVETASEVYSRRMREFPEWYPTFYREMIERTGHIGLEPPAAVLRRLEHHGFEIVRAQYLSMHWGYARGHVSWASQKYPPTDRRDALLRKLSTLVMQNQYAESLFDDCLGLLDVLVGRRVPKGDALAVMVVARARRDDAEAGDRVGARSAS